MRVCFVCVSVKSLCQRFREASKRVEYLVWISLWHDVEEGEAQHTFFLLVLTVSDGARHRATVAALAVTTKGISNDMGSSSTDLYNDSSQ